uniref:Ubiquitin-like protease family profile domain-containing protein n=1 Tax=Lactuca sativa TaxID=4236 RepID=A0A9R1XE83_LACSA|nr:hypothetical protein LSAT_V11C400217670 [Lactuca sativa]
MHNIEEEVNSLKDNVLKTEVAALVIGKIYDEEYEKGKELRARFQVAEEVCQQAYTHLYSLKKRLYDKKKLFYMYIEDATAARNFASGGDKVALHQPCVNQVEKIMEESNSNEEFRKDNISRTTPSTLVETSPESHMNERIAVKAVPISSKLESISVVSKVEQGKKTASCVSDICERIATNAVSISSETESVSLVSLVSKVEQRKKTSPTPENQTIWKVDRKTNRKLENSLIFLRKTLSLFLYHWSLIVMCHLGEVAKYKDEEDVTELIKVPCVLHMDPIRGSHTGLKGLMQSYLKEEWKGRQQEASKDISSRFDNLRFISLELPQQPNSFDCGLFLLHYVELFLEQAPINFNPFKITKSVHFVRTWTIYVNINNISELLFVNM